MQTPGKRDKKSQEHFLKMFQHFKKFRPQPAAQLPAQRDRRLKKWTPLIKEFYAKNGRFPGQTETYKGKHIGNACNNIRQMKKRGTLDENIIKALNKIGFIWESGRKTIQDKVNLIKAFYTQHQIAAKPDKDKVVKAAENYLRKIRKKGMLQESFINQLDEIGFDWRPPALNKSPQEWVNLIREFWAEKGRLPLQRELYKSENIGTACAYLRQKKKKGALSKSIIKQLNRINFVYEKNHTDQEWVDLIKKFKQERGRLPHQTERYYGINIGRACILLRTKRKEDRLAGEIIGQLDDLDFVWRFNFNKPEEWLKLIKKFKKEYGRLPMQIEKYHGKNIGFALNALKQKKRKGLLNWRIGMQLEGLGK